VTPERTENLCTSCGLCCDGSLFAEVELRNQRESFNLESFGLEIEEGDDGELLMQPCGALKGTRCTIYRHRPNCCRTFECRLLRDVNEGKRNLSEAHEIIRETRQMVAHIARSLPLKNGQPPLPLKERYFAALENLHERDTEKYTRLKDAMASLEQQIETNFLV
jgi:Fe-S-cluster containining protein